MNPFLILLRTFLFIKTRSLRQQLLLKVNKIKNYASDYKNFSDAELLRDFHDIQEKAKYGSPPAEIEVPLFSLISEFSRRRLRMEPFDVQLLAALILRRRKVIQMDTGEGKTLVAPFYAILETLYGRQVVIVTPNDYLSSRDFEWMRPLYDALGISVSTVQSWFTVEMKSRAYQHQVIYVSTDQVVFDFLRKNHSLTKDSDFPIPKETVIIDEIDNVLIDQGSKPYALVQQINFEPEIFPLINAHISSFFEGKHFTGIAKTKELEITDKGYEKIESLAPLCNIPITDCLFYVKSALSASHLFRRNKDYIVESGKIIPIDEITGRPQHGQSFAFGTHQAIEVKERVSMSFPNTIINKISLYSFFSKFERIAGMSGSALHNTYEFKLVHNLEVVPIPRNKPCVRLDLNDSIYQTKKEALDAAAKAVEKAARLGRPVLIGTTNIEDAEMMARKLAAMHLDFYLLSAKNHFEEAEIIALAGEAGRITVVAQMAGRGVDIKLKEEAREAGGLFMIGISRSTNRRLDEQLIGRSGRQGDPGSSRFFISLEDDLMRIFGSDWLSSILTSLGLNEGEPIEHSMVTKAVFRAQKQLTLSQFKMRKSLILMEKHLQEVRNTIFSRREEIAAQDQYDEFVKRVIIRYVDHFQLLNRAESEEKLLELGKRCNLRISPHLRQSILSGEPEVFKKDLVEFLEKEYYRRRERVDFFARNRERMILLRSIDYCWSQFLDRYDRIFEEMTLMNQQIPIFQFIAERFQKMKDSMEELQNEIDQKSFFYLMHIDNSEMLQEIKYWRGLGVVFGFGKEVGLDDGINVPDEYLSIFKPQKEPSDVPTGSTKLLTGSEEQKQDELTFPTFVKKYLDHLQKAGMTNEENLMHISNVLKEFMDFLKDDNMGLRAAQKGISAYLVYLKDHNIKYWNIIKIKKILIGIFDFAKQEKWLERKTSAVIRDDKKNRLKKFVAGLFNPLFIFQSAIIILAYIAYRAFSNLSIPYITFAPGANPFYEFSAPPYFIKFVDELLLCGALKNIGLGVLGILPVVLTKLILLRRSKDWDISTPILYLPSIMIFSLIIQQFLIRTADNAVALTLLHKVLIFLSLFLGTVLLVLFLWILDFIQFVNFIQFLILGNSVMILIREWKIYATSVNYSVISLMWPLLFLLILVLYYLYTKTSKVSFNIIRSGKFDFKAGEIKNVSTTVTFASVYTGYHYLFAFGLILLLEILFGSSIQSILQKYPLLQNSSVLTYWRIPVYFFLVYWMMSRLSMRKLSADNIKDFFKKTDSFIQDYQDWKQGISFVQKKVRQKVLTNSVFETVILGSLMTFMAFLFIQKGWLHILYITSISASAIYLLIFAGRQIKGLLYQTADLVVYLTPPEEKPDLGLTWYKKIYFAVKERWGFIGIFFTLITLVQIFEYVFKKLLELIRHIF